MHASEEFRHCLASSQFLLRRDALARAYRPEDLGHRTSRRIDAEAADLLRHRAGIELQMSGPAQDRAAAISLPRAG